MINMNKESIFLRDYENGTHQGIEIQVGRMKYLLDIRCDIYCANIDLYKPCEHGKYSPEANLKTVTVHRGSVLNKAFFIDFSEIAKAQAVLTHYWNIYGIEVLI